MEQRLIDANALMAREEINPFIKTARGQGKTLLHACKLYLRAVVDVAPTVDAVPVVHGRWLLDGRCSECLANPLTTHKTYCPSCGAKMMEVDE